MRPTHVRNPPLYADAAIWRDTCNASQTAVWGSQWFGGGGCLQGVLSMRVGWNDKGLLWRHRTF
jgi:hypothetical protein